jgi:hypothetical protein
MGKDFLTNRFAVRSKVMIVRFFRGDSPPVFGRFETEDDPWEGEN